jgi:hypothetical protein
MHHSHGGIELRLLADDHGVSARTHGYRGDARCRVRWWLRRSTTAAATRENEEERNSKPEVAGGNLQIVLTGQGHGGLPAAR